MAHVISGQKLTKRILSSTARRDPLGCSDSPGLTTVVARDDSIREGNHRGLVTMTVSSLDGRFDGIAVDPVTVMIEDDDCDALEAPTHGQLLPPGCGNEYGDICTVQCDAGRAPVAGVEVECLSSTGDWDQARPTCEACAQDYFEQDGTCVACSTSECGVGFYRGKCGASSDAACEGCTTKPLHSSYTTSGQPWDTDNCSWACDGEHWRSGESCTSCTTSGCPAGEYRGACGTESDAGCLACDASELPQYSHFVSGADVHACAWTCNAVYNETSPGVCVSSVIPRIDITTTISSFLTEMDTT